MRWDARRERLPESLRARFEPLAPDPLVEAFAQARAEGHGPIRDAAHRALRRVVSDFDADGWLGTHRMAMLGPASFEALLGRGARLLDVGAGSGDLTEHLRGLFDLVATTETSAPMARRLRRRGFPCWSHDLAARAMPVEEPFDAVTLLNVLDRCDRPRTLLRRASALLADGGRMLVSVPLPARPHWDVGGATVDPDEPLGGEGEGFEEALADLVERTFDPLDLEVLRLARAPYVSRGRKGRAPKILDAGLAVLRPAPPS